MNFFCEMADIQNYLLIEYKDEYQKSKWTIECRIFISFIWSRSELWNRNNNNVFMKKRKLAWLDFVDYTCLTSLEGVFSDLEALLVLGFRRFSSRSVNKPREVVLSPALSIIGKDVLLKFCIFFTFIFSSAATKFLEDWPES